MKSTLIDFSQPVDVILGEMERLDIAVSVRWFGKSVTKTDILFGLGDKTPTLAALQMMVEIESRFTQDPEFREAVAVYTLSLGEALQAVEKPAWEFKLVSHEQVAAERAAALS